MNDDPAPYATLWVPEKEQVVPSREQNVYPLGPVGVELGVDVLVPPPDMFDTVTVIVPDVPMLPEASEALVTKV